MTRSYSRRKPIVLVMVSTIFAGTCGSLSGVWGGELEAVIALTISYGACLGFVLGISTALFLNTLVSDLDWPRLKSTEIFLLSLVTLVSGGVGSLAGGLLLVEVFQRDKNASDNLYFALPLIVNVLVAMMVGSILMLFYRWRLSINAD